MADYFDAPCRDSPGQKLLAEVGSIGHQMKALAAASALCPLTLGA